MREPSDRELVRGARRGDRDAAAALFRRYWREAWRAAYARHRQAGARGRRRGRRVRARLRRARPLRRAAAVRAVAAPDRRQPRARPPPRGARLADEELPEIVDVVADRRGGDRGLLGAVAELSLERRVVVVLRYGVGMTPKQIAAALDLPVGTVNSRLARALDAAARDARGGTCRAELERRLEGLLAEAPEPEAGVGERALDRALAALALPARRERRPLRIAVVLAAAALVLLARRRRLARGGGRAARQPRPRRSRALPRPTCGCRPGAPGSPPSSTASSPS